VTDNGSQDLYVINPDTMQVSSSPYTVYDRITKDFRSNALSQTTAIVELRGRLYVANYGMYSISEYDANNYTKIQDMPAGGQPKSNQYKTICPFRTNFVINLRQYKSSCV
jgi:hypothetical protein